MSSHLIPVYDHPRKIQEMQSRGQRQLSAHLIHAGLVQSHNGGMSQAVINSPQGLLGVELLGFEQFLYKVFIEHG